MKPAVILADFGTTFTKWALLIRDGDSAYHLEEPTAEPSESERPLQDGGCEWDPRKFIRRMVQSVLEANLRANKLGCVVRGICCTGTTTSTAALSARNLVPAIPSIRWDDQRAAAQAASLEDLRIQHDACPWMRFGADTAPARAYWLVSQHEHDLVSGTSMIEQIDLVSFFWTGNRVLSETIASRKWGFTANRPWEPAFAEAVSSLLRGHLEDLLPSELAAAGTPVGTILPVLAEAYGLSPFTKIIAAPYDTVAQVLGLGLVSAPGAATVSLGTSMGVCCLAPEPTLSRRTPYGPFPDMPFRGFGMLVDGLKSCGSAIDLVCTMALGPKTDAKAYYETIAQCLRDTSPGADGISVVPYFNGGLRSTIGSPPALIRGFRDSKQKHLVRAVFEAMAYHIRLIIENFELVAGVNIQRILIGGGPSRSSEFMHIVADATNREVHVTRYSDSGLLGCAVCAATGLNWFDNYHQASQQLTASNEVIQPTPPLAVLYNDLYEQYRQELPLGRDSTQEMRHVC